ncbi:MAG: GatB/YqeY domain-containing protein [Lachnospiraceae bacterium]|nr:GatB/YqeY domain-containing protein [Lachnospiraceae bacterium]
MSRIDEVRAQMMQAMKEHKKERKDALSALLTALKNKAIDKREDLTAEEENAVVLKEIKALKETLELTPANRTDIVEECKFRISVLEEFAPEMMGEEEIKTAVKEVLDELGVTQPSVQDKGKIMKALMPKVKGKADGKLVSEVLAGMLAE